MDGVAYITQCPIGPGQTFTYKFKVNTVNALFRYDMTFLHKTYAKRKINAKSVFPVPWNMKYSEEHHTNNANLLNFCKAAHSITRCFKETYAYLFVL